MIDTFDRLDFDEDIVFDSEKLTKFKRNEKDLLWSAIVGDCIVKTGMIKSWKFQIEAKKSVIGIIDNQKFPINAFSNIGDHTNTRNEGYGMY